MAAVHEVEVREGDTRPILEWVMKDNNGQIIDMSHVGRSATLYYQEERTGKTVWALALPLASGGVDGVVRYTASPSKPYRPSGYDGVRTFEGRIVYLDTSDGTQATLEGALQAKTLPALAAA